MPTGVSDWTERLQLQVSQLAYDARFTVSALALTLLSITLLHCAAAWGRARARRRTARAVAQAERSGPPEAPTWEHSHSTPKNKLHKESR
jgi:hypothetical protein